MTTLVRRKVRAGFYQLYHPSTEQVRAEIVRLPDPIVVDSMDHWMVYIDGDAFHHDGLKARTLRDAEANARAHIAYIDANPVDERSDQQRIRDANAARSPH